MVHDWIDREGNPERRCGVISTTGSCHVLTAYLWRERVLDRVAGPGGNRGARFGAFLSLKPDFGKRPPYLGCERRDGDVAEGCVDVVRQQQQ